MSAKRQPKRARPSGEPVAQFEIGNFSHAHAEELCPELPRGLHREVWIDRGPGVTPLRADRVDFEKRVVYEVKPDNGYWRAKGEEQLRVYKGYMDHQFPPAPGQGPWETKLVTYDYESALRTLKKWGYLK